MDKGFEGELKRVQAVVTGSHFVYTSGLHGSVYVNKDAIYPHTKLISEIGREFGGQFRDAQVEAVIAPAVGGVILATWTAYHLSRLTKREVLGVYADKIEGTKEFELKRGYDKLIAGKRVLVVEDVVTTGGSVAKVIKLTKKIATVVGLAVICNRGQVGAKELGVDKLYSLVQANFAAWAEKECPLCQKKIPINLDLGKGRDYLRKKGKLA
jgi:orotate phosphoribosyltransferase